VLPATATAHVSIFGPICPNAPFCKGSCCPKWAQLEHRARVAFLQFRKRLGYRPVYSNLSESQLVRGGAYNLGRSYMYTAKEKEISL
jgi:hypothetical protein